MRNEAVFLIFLCLCLFVVPAFPPLRASSPLSCLSSPVGKPGGPCDPRRHENCCELHVRCRETDGESIDQGEEKCAEKPVVQANRPTALNEKASYPSKSAKILFSEKGI